MNVIAKLTGELFRPSFDFQIEFPQNFYTSVDQRAAFSLEQGIRQIERNPNELNKQVAYLIVLNQFAPYETSSSSAFNPLNEFAYSTISGLLFGEINKRLNQLLSKILNNNDLTVNFTGSLYNSNLVNQSSGGFQINQSNLNINVGMPILKERVLLSLGGTFDVPLESDLQQNIQLFPDVTVEFLINKSGTLRATIFYRASPDLQFTPGSTRSVQRAGANMAYRRDFNTLSGFFSGKNRGKKKAAARKPATDSVFTESTQ